MKKSIFFSMCAASMMLFTACQDDLDNGLKGEDGNVTFSVEVPSNIASRAFGDGTKALNLSYAVYESGQQTPLITSTDEVKFTGLKATVNMRLVNGKTYDIVFWADNENAPYAFNAATQTVTVDYAQVANQNENFDAFFKAETLKVEGTINETIQLTRPFAQINIGATDYAVATQFGFTTASSSVKVGGVANTLNLLTGVVSGEETITFASAAVPGEGETFPATGVDADYLSMTYVLVGADKTITDVEFTATSTNQETVTRKYTNVPVQRNYRTNIYGNILTEAANFNVEIVPGFNEPPYSNIDLLKEAAANGGEVTLYSDLTIDEEIAVAAGKEMTLNLNGYTITVNGEASLSSAGEDAKLTINGDGTVQMGTGHDGPAVWAYNEGSIVINGGTFIGTDDANGLRNDLIYVGRGANTLPGYLTVNGGEFMYNGQNQEGHKFLINKNDKSKASSEVEVKGGTFHKYNPAATQSENPVENWVADNYMVTLVAGTNDVYEVKEVQWWGMSGEIKLQGDLNLTAPIVPKKDSTLTVDLNGKTITNEDGNVFEVLGKNKKLVIKGDGVVRCNGGTKVNSPVYVEFGEAVIEGGEYYSNDHVTDGVTYPDGCVVAIYGAKVTIKGGKFKYEGTVTDGAKCTLDENKGWEPASTIIVEGGEYYNFNPTSFLATGKNATQSGDWYNVQ